MAESMSSSKSLRAGLRAAGRVDRWDEEAHKVQRDYNPHEVRMHCVQNSEWQQIRLSMKGVDTVDKLDILIDWWDKQMAEADRLMRSDASKASSSYARGRALAWATEVQVGNYLGAIRRGGQLDDDNRIRKER